MIALLNSTFTIYLFEIFFMDKQTIYFLFPSIILRSTPFF